MEELIADMERRERMRVLARQADERWIEGGGKETGKLTIGSSEDALKGSPFLLGGGMLMGSCTRRCTRADAGERAAAVAE